MVAGKVVEKGKETWNFGTAIRPEHVMFDSFFHVVKIPFSFWCLFAVFSCGLLETKRTARVLALVTLWCVFVEQHNCGSVRMEDRIVCLTKCLGSWLMKMKTMLETGI